MDAMALMPAASVDVIVTDPPYGLGFMGKAWDDLPPGLEWAREAFRIVKPGAHVLAFGGTRTYHRLACALEDAGFEIRDTLAWLYGSGFPKSHDVGKAIDKAAGAARAQVPATGGLHNNRNLNDDGWSKIGAAAPLMDSPAPATPEAERWAEWGTALKPAFEPVVVARKPLAGTVAANVLAHGTGALNIGACRVGDDARVNEAGELGAHGIYGRMERVGEARPATGRWPANVVMDEEAAAMLDAQAPNVGAIAQASGPTRAGRSDNYSGRWHGTDEAAPFYGARGGASRFLYVAKASKAEREAGLEAMAAAPAGVKNDPYAVVRRRNTHPTVKPIALMRWLVRLVTPPDGLVLDPFAGTGTTGIAAGLEGFRFAGVEREPEYVEIATARLAWWAEQPRAVEVADALAAQAERERLKATGQLELAP